MVHELVVEVSVQRILRSRTIIDKQLHCGELGIEECSVVAVK